MAFSASDQIDAKRHLNLPPTSPYLSTQFAILINLDSTTGSDYEKRVKEVIQILNETELQIVQARSEGEANEGIKRLKIDGQIEEEYFNPKAGGGPLASQLANYQYYRQILGNYLNVTAEPNWNETVGVIAAHS